MNGSAGSAPVNSNFSITPASLYFLSTTFLILALLAPLIVAVFVDPFSKFACDRDEDDDSSHGASTLRQGI
jgi:hypothetical protein